MNFAIQVHDWFVRVVWVGINQSQARIVKDIINSENCYVIYLLHIIDIQNNNNDVSSKFTVFGANWKCPELTKVIIFRHNFYIFAILNT